MKALSRIRLSSLQDVLFSAEEVARGIIATYAKPNLTPEQIQSAAINNEDPYDISATFVASNSNSCKGKYDWQGVWTEKRSVIGYRARDRSRRSPSDLTRQHFHSDRT
jgi:predicted transcriptional regulator